LVSKGSRKWDIEAQNDLASLYYNGKGTEKNLERPFIGIKKLQKMEIFMHIIMEKEQKRI